MAIFIPEINGYIIDNPNIDFVRCDGKVFSYDEVNTASWTNNAESVSINGGWSNFPLAVIPTSKTSEFTFESSQFDLNMFAMAHATEVTEGDVGSVESARFDVATGLKITLPFEVQASSVYIRGFEQATTLAAGKFTVAVTAATAETAGSTEITFNEGDVAVGDTIRVAYKRRLIGAYNVEESSTANTAKGELFVHWPVYSSGVDCADAAIKGRLHLDIFRVRATAMPGFSNSFKSASTNSVTFSTLDPKRADGKTSRMSYEPMDAEGNLITKGSGTVNWN